MKILQFKNKAYEAANRLLDEAKKNEQKITKDLKEVALSKKSRLVGLKNKFKEQDSLAEKLSNNSIKWNQPLANEAKRNNDTLRYTMIFSLNKYQSGYKQVLDELAKRGYQVQKMWDAWQMEGTENDTGYRGINVTIISSQMQKFELQFHTAQSFRVKTETHGLYEERRNPKTDRQRDVEILEIMKEIASEIKRPKGV
jgi:hypothetical protein